MFEYGKKHHLVTLYMVFVAIIVGAMGDLSSTEITIPTTVTPTTEDRKNITNTARIEREATNSVSDDVKKTTTTTTLTPNVVLQPNVTGALDVGQGLLVPLVPVVDTNSNASQANQSPPLTVNLLPVPLSVTDDNHPEIRRSASLESYQDLDVAEDIIFRPLFKYRQEAQEKLNQKRYQAYIYAYKRPQKNTPRQRYLNYNYNNY